VVAEYGAEGTDKALSDDTWGGGDRATVLKINKGGKEIWAQVHPNNRGGGYALYIAERETMKQSIAVNELVDEINKKGFIALYINFDTGKGTIKPDSFSQLDQVVTALKQATELKLEVGGHTDNVGTPAANMSLSEIRAKAVMKYLTNKGIAASRLTVKGYGQTSQVADNRSEEGRARNRRVELVKK
jgi:outer membrane protein OmpA-like peptidoglycan-associated protein